MNFTEWKTLNDSHQNWKRFVQKLLKDKQHLDETIKKELIQEIQQIDLLLADFQSTSNNENSL